MSYLYVIESTRKFGFSDGCLVAKDLVEGTETSVPFNQVDGISIYGNAQLSTQLIRECLISNRPISYYSEDGHYFGMVKSFDFIDPERQKRQIYLSDNAAFCLAWSKQIIEAKIANSLALLRSFADCYRFSEAELHGLLHSMQYLDTADTIDILLGFEGSAARCYFQCLAKLVPDNALEFRGRSTRPPKDPVNSMLSYGYSLLYRMIIGLIEHHDLHPYFAFMHKLQHGHAALASDLVEEYRAFIVDRAVLSLLNSGEIRPANFYRNDAGAIYMTKPLMKKLTDALSESMDESHRYFASSGDHRAYGFRAMMDKKLDAVVSAIISGDATRYLPFYWVEGI